MPFAAARRLVADSCPEPLGFRSAEASQSRRSLRLLGEREGPAVGGDDPRAELPAQGVLVELEQDRVRAGLQLDGDAVLVDAGVPREVNSSKTFSPFTQTFSLSSTPSKRTASTGRSSKISA